MKPTETFCSNGSPVIPSMSVLLPLTRRFGRSGLRSCSRVRASADIRPGASRKGRFAYSTDGVTFLPIGTGFTLNNAWQFFMGYRFAVFNYATTALGGAVDVEAFELTGPPLDFPTL